MKTIKEFLESLDKKLKTLGTEDAFKRNELTEFNELRKNFASQGEKPLTLNILAPFYRLLFKRSKETHGTSEHYNADTMSLSFINKIHKELANVLCEAEAVIAAEIKPKPPLFHGDIQHQFAARLAKDLYDPPLTFMDLIENLSKVDRHYWRCFVTGFIETEVYSLILENNGKYELHYTENELSLMETPPYSTKHKLHTPINIEQSSQKSNDAENVLDKALIFCFSQKYAITRAKGPDYYYGGAWMNYLSGGMPKQEKLNGIDWLQAGLLSNALLENINSFLLNKGIPEKAIKAISDKGDLWKEIAPFNEHALLETFVIELAEEINKENVNHAKMSA